MFLYINNNSTSLTQYGKLLTKFKVNNFSRTVKCEDVGSVIAALKGIAPHEVVLLEVSKVLYREWDPILFTIQQLRNQRNLAISTCLTLPYIGLLEQSDFAVRQTASSITVIKDRNP